MRPFVPPKDWTIRIEDMIDEGERVQRFTAGVDFEAFVSNEKTVYAVPA